MANDSWDDFEEDDINMDGGEYDDDMFADFEEGGAAGNGDAGGPRSPTSEAFQSFTAGVSRSFTEPSTINRFVDAALPSKLREVKSHFEEGLDGSIEGYDKMEEGNKSILGMNSSAVGGFLGLKGVKEYGDDLQEEAKDDQDDAFAEANKNNSRLDEIFTKQAEGQREEAIAGQAQVAAEGKASDKRHAGSMGAMGAVLAQLKNIHQFSTDVTFKYQRANLETNLKSYDAIRNMVTLTKDIGEASVKALTALVKNTSLPEHNKVSLGEMGTQSFASHGIEGFTGALTDRGSFGERLGKKGHDFFTNVVAPKLATQEEFMTMLNQPGVTKSGLVGDLLADKAVGLMASLAGTSIRKLPFTKTERAKKLAAMIEAIPESGERDLVKWLGKKTDVKEADGVIVTYLKESVQGFLDMAGLGSKLSVNGQRELDMKQTTFIAQTKVVPRLLSKILSQVTAIRTGDTDMREMEFDYNTERFRLRPQGVNPLERMQSHFGRDAMNEAAKDAALELTDETDLHDGDIAALQYTLAAAAMSNALGSSEQGTLHEFLASSDFQQLDIDTRTRLETALNARANDFHTQYSEVAKETRVPDKTIEALVGGGFHGPLLDAGILRETGEAGETTLEIDPVRYKAWLNVDGLIEAANAANPRDVTDLVGPLPEGTVTREVADAVSGGDRIIIVPNGHNAHNGGRGPSDGSSVIPVTDNDGNVIGSLLNGPMQDNNPNRNGRGPRRKYAKSTGHISTPPIVDDEGNPIGWIEAPNAGIRKHGSNGQHAIRGRSASGKGPADDRVKMIVDDEGRNIGFIGGSSTAEGGHGFVGPLPSHSGAGGANFVGPAGPNQKVGVIRDPKTRSRIRRILFGVSDLNPLRRADIEDILVQPGRISNTSLDTIYKILNRNRGITDKRMKTFRKIARGKVSEEEIDKLMGDTEMGKMRTDLMDKGAEKAGYVRSEGLDDEEAAKERNLFIRNAILQKLAFTGIDKWIEEGGDPKAALAGYGFKPTGLDSKVLVGKVKQNGKKVLAQAKSAYNMLKTPALKLTSRDLYDPQAMGAPLLQHSMIGKGAYFDHKGKELKRTTDLDKNGVFDKHGNVVVTPDQLEAGLVTMDGKPIKGVKGAYNRLQRMVRRGIISPIYFAEKGVKKASGKFKKKYQKALDLAKDKFMDKVPEKYREQMAKAVDDVTSTAGLVTLKRKLQEVVTFENFDRVVNSVNKDNFNKAIDSINKENYQRLKGQFSEENLDKLTEAAKEKLAATLTPANKAKLAQAMRIKDIKAISKKARSSTISRGLGMFKSARTMSDVKEAMEVIRLGVEAEDVKNIVNERANFDDETDAEKAVRKEKEAVKEEKDKSWKERWDEKEKNRKEERAKREKKEKEETEEDIKDEKKKKQKKDKEDKELDDELSELKDDNNDNSANGVIRKLKRLYIDIRGGDGDDDAKAIEHSKKIEDAHTEALRESEEKKDKSDIKKKREERAHEEERDDRLKAERKEEAKIREAFERELGQDALSTLGKQKVTHAEVVKEMAKYDREEAEEKEEKKQKKDDAYRRERDKIEDDRAADLENSYKLTREQEKEVAEQVDRDYKQRERERKNEEKILGRKRRGQKKKDSGIMNKIHSILRRTGMVKQRRKVKVEPQTVEQAISLANLETNRETLKETKEIRTDASRSRMFSAIAKIGSSLLFMGGMMGSLLKYLGVGLAGAALKHFGGKIFKGKDGDACDIGDDSRRRRRRGSSGGGGSRDGSRDSSRAPDNDSRNSRRGSPRAPVPASESRNSRRGSPRSSGSGGSEAARRAGRVAASVGRGIGVRGAARVAAAGVAHVVGGVVSGPVGWAMLAAEGLYWTRKAVYGAADFVGMGDHVYDVAPSGTIMDAFNEWYKMEGYGGSEAVIEAGVDGVLGFDLSAYFRGKPRKWDIYRYLQYGIFGDKQQVAVAKWENSLLQSGFFVMGTTRSDGSIKISTDMSQLNMPNLMKTFGHTPETVDSLIRWFEKRYVPLAKRFLSAIHKVTGQMEFKAYERVNHEKKRQILYATQWERHYDRLRSNPFGASEDQLEPATQMVLAAYKNLMADIKSNETYNNVTQVTAMTGGRNKRRLDRKQRTIHTPANDAYGANLTPEEREVAGLTAASLRTAGGSGIGGTHIGSKGISTSAAAAQVMAAYKAHGPEVPAGTVPALPERQPMTPQTGRNTRAAAEPMYSPRDYKQRGRMPAYTKKSSDFHFTGKRGRISNWKEMLSYIDAAAEAVGVDKHILRAMSYKESHLDPFIRTYRKRNKDGTYTLQNKDMKNQSAQGLFQVIDSTWNSAMSKWGKKYNIQGRKKTDPYANAIIGASLIKSGERKLKRLRGNSPLTPGEAYSILFMGEDDAAKFARKLKSNPKGNSSKGMMAPANANPGIFGRRGWTKKNKIWRNNRQVMAELERRMGDAMGQKWLHKDYNIPIPELLPAGVGDSYQGGGYVYRGKMTDASYANHTKRSKKRRSSKTGRSYRPTWVPRGGFGKFKGNKQGTKAGPAGTYATLQKQLNDGVLVEGEPGTVPAMPEATLDPKVVKYVQKMHGNPAGFDSPMPDTGGDKSKGGYYAGIYVGKDATKRGRRRTKMIESEMDYTVTSDGRKHILDATLKGGTASKQRVLDQQHKLSSENKEVMAKVLSGQGKKYVYDPYKGYPTMKARAAAKLRDMRKYGHLSGNAHLYKNGKLIADPAAKAHSEKLEVHRKEAGTSTAQPAELNQEYVDDVYHTPSRVYGASNQRAAKRADKKRWEQNRAKNRAKYGSGPVPSTLKSIVQPINYPGEEWVPGSRPATPEQIALRAQVAAGGGQAAPIDKAAPKLDAVLTELKKQTDIAKKGVVLEVKVKGVASKDVSVRNIGHAPTPPPKGTVDSFGAKPNNFKKAYN